MAAVAAVEALLRSVGLGGDAELLSECLRLFEASGAKGSAASLNALFKSLRASVLTPEGRAEFDDAFSKLVVKDKGGLPDMLAFVEECILAVAESHAGEVAAAQPTQTTAANGPTSRQNTAKVGAPVAASALPPVFGSGRSAAPASASAFATAATASFSSAAASFPSPPQGSALDLMLRHSLQAAVSPGSSDQDDGSGDDAAALLAAVGSPLRYGSAVMLRCSSSSSSSLSSDGTGTGSGSHVSVVSAGSSPSASAAVRVSGFGTGHGREVFIIEKANADDNSNGNSSGSGDGSGFVRNGDSIVLRHAASGKLLSASADNNWRPSHGFLLSSPSSSSVISRLQSSSTVAAASLLDALPVAATPEARHACCQGTQEGSPSSSWTILSPDALGASLAQHQHQHQHQYQSARRPVIFAHQQVALLSHQYDSSDPMALLASATTAASSQQQLQQLQAAGMSARGAAALAKFSAMSSNGGKTDAAASERLIRTAVMRMFLLTSNEVSGDFVSLGGQRVKRRTRAVYIDAAAPEDPLWANKLQQQQQQQQQKGAAGQFLPLPLHLLMGGTSGDSSNAATMVVGPSANVVKSAAALVACPSSSQLWTMTPVSVAAASTSQNNTESGVNHVNSSLALAVRAQKGFGGHSETAAVLSQAQPDWLSSRAFQQLELQQGTFLPSPVAAMAFLSSVTGSPRLSQQLAAYFSGAKRASAASMVPLSSHPLAVQEAVLVSSLLFALGGIPSRYVRAKSSQQHSHHSQQSLQHTVGSRSSPLLAAALAAAGGNLEFVLACDDPAGLASSLPFSTLSPSLLSSIPSQSVAALSLLFAPDPSLGFVARKVLPLAGLYARCKYLVACLKAGTGSGGSKGAGVATSRVRQALGSACDTLLGEYESLLIQLEAVFRQGSTAGGNYDLLANAAASVGRPLNPSTRPGHSPATTLAGPAAPAASSSSLSSLSLQQLWFYVQPAMRTLSCLQTVLDASVPLHGGELLNRLISFSQSFSGEEASKALVDTLLQRAAMPYMAFLSDWIYRGRLPPSAAGKDSEFMVIDNDNGKGSEGDDNDDGNQQADNSSLLLHGRFSVHADPKAIPFFLRPHAESILKAGKYIRILRACVQALTTMGGGGRGATRMLRKLPHLIQLQHQQNLAAAASSALAPSSSSTSGQAALALRRGSDATVVSLVGGGEGSASSPSFHHHRTAAATTSSSSSVHIGSHLQPMSPADSRRMSRMLAMTTAMTTGAGATAAPPQAQQLRDESSSSSSSSQESSVPGRNLSRGGAFSSAGVPHRPVSVLPSGSATIGPGGLLVPAAPEALSLAPLIAAALSSSVTGSNPATALLKFVGGGHDPTPYAAPITAAAAYASRELLHFFYSGLLDASSVPRNHLFGRASPEGALSSWLSSSQHVSMNGNGQQRLGGMGLSLHSRLTTLKGFFLLARGDYLAAFFDVAENELQREKDPSSSSSSSSSTGGVTGRSRSIGGRSGMAGGGGTKFGPGSGAALSAQRLRNLLELALRSSTAMDDPNRDDVSLALAPMSILAQASALAAGKDAFVEPAGRSNAVGAGGSLALLSSPMAAGATSASSSSSAAGSGLSSLKGYNSVTLALNPGFPLSLVLHRRVLTKYQLLFRHLAFTRYVERAVCHGCWIAQQSCKDLHGLQQTLATSFALRHRMVHFLQQLTYYNMVEVIEPRWHAMGEQLRSAATLDEVVAIHDACVDDCLRDVLLGGASSAQAGAQDLLKLQTKLITLCLLFAHQITNAIDSHRLSEQELDRRAGLNKASVRSRLQAEKGEYYHGGGDNASVVSFATSAVTGRFAGRNNARDADGGADNDDDDASSVASHRSSASRVGAGRGGSSSRRLSSGLSSRGEDLSAGVAKSPKLSPEGAQASKDRARRAARQQVQTEAMQHTMAQQGWQAMITKSSRMFDALLKDFLQALVNRASSSFASSSSPSSSSSSSSTVGGLGGSASAAEANLLHLVARLDHNGFYSRAFGLAM